MCVRISDVTRQNFTPLGACLDHLVKFYTLSHRMFRHIHKVLNINEKN